MSIRPSFYQFCVVFILHWVTGSLESLPRTWGKRAGTSWIECQPITRHSHTHILTAYKEFKDALQPKTHFALILKYMKDTLKQK